MRTVALADQARNIETGVMNEPLPWYTGDSPWGGPIASPTQTASLMLGILYGSDGSYLPIVCAGHRPHPGDVRCRRGHLRAGPRLH